MDLPSVRKPGLPRIPLPSIPSLAFNLPLLPPPLCPL
jgi:hypothetical protein